MSETIVRRRASSSVSSVFPVAKSRSNHPPFLSTSSTLSNDSLIRNRILRIACCSRFLVWLLGVLANAFARSYDLCMQTETQSHPLPTQPLDFVVQRLFECFAHWDVVQFTSIATLGYEFEKQHAFFPFLPLLMRYCGLIVSWLFPSMISPYYAMVLCGFLFSNLCFIGGSLVLFSLSKAVLNDSQLAYRSSVMFCVTPAAVFMSAIYTESFFSFFAFLGLLCFVRERYAAAAMCFALTCAIRSNGSMLISYFVFAALHALFSTELTLGKKFFKIARLALCSIFSLLPLLAFQYYGYYKYCVQTESPQPYCSRMIPNIYNHVQARYWNVGLFNYYEIKQIPNFALASVTLILSISGVWSFLKRDWLQFFTAGLLRRTNITLGFAGNRNALIFVYNWALLLLIALTVLHVQVTTRFMSATPPLYWFAATLLTPIRSSSSASCSLSLSSSSASSSSSMSLFPSPSSSKSKPSSFIQFSARGDDDHDEQIPCTGRLLLASSLVYAVLGTCFFCTYLPWT